MRYELFIMSLGQTPCAPDQFRTWTSMIGTPFREICVSSPQEEVTIFNLFNYFIARILRVLSFLLSISPFHLGGVCVCVCVCVYTPYGTSFLYVLHLNPKGSGHFWFCLSVFKSGYYMLLSHDFCIQDDATKLNHSHSLPLVCLGYIRVNYRPIGKAATAVKQLIV